MLILLPPSEAKQTPAVGHVFDMNSLSFSELNSIRELVLAALEKVSSSKDAHRELKVSEKLSDQILANTRIRRAVAGPANQVYTGVLYSAGNLADLTAAAHHSRALVFSALWGAAGLFDAIAPYRLSITAPLPDVAPLARWWRPHLAAALDPIAADELVVDCRSSGYQAMWRPPAAATVVTVEVVRVAGTKRTVVSHHAKYLRGVLAGALLRSGAPEPKTSEGLADYAYRIAADHGPVPTGETVRGVELNHSRGSDVLTFVTAM